MKTCYVSQLHPMYGDTLIVAVHTSLKDALVWLETIYPYHPTYGGWTEVIDLTDSELYSRVHVLSCRDINDDDYLSITLTVIQ